jgi:hypothetical protein
VGSLTPHNPIGLQGLLRDSFTFTFTSCYCCYSWLQGVLGVLKAIGIITGGIPVPTAWRVLGLRMEERPPDMEVSCEYIE